METMTVGRERGWRTGLRWVARAGVVAWTGFWAWFVVAVAIGDIRSGLSGTVFYASGMLALFLGLGLTALLRPRVGGPLLVAAGVASMFLVAQPSTMALLGGPAIVLGVLAFLSGRRRGGGALRPA